MTRAQLRVELLLAAGAVLAGAAAGMIAQAGAELVRARRETRDQLRAAGGQLDAIAGERDQLAAELALSKLLLRAAAVQLIAARAGVSVQPAHNGPVVAGELEAGSVCEPDTRPSE